MTSVTPLSGAVITTYTYDIAGRLTDQVRSDERAYTYTWSNQGQLLEEWIVGVSLAPVREFVYDGAGRIMTRRTFLAQNCLKDSVEASTRAYWSSQSFPTELATIKCSPIKWGKLSKKGLISPFIEHRFVLIGLQHIGQTYC